MYDLRVLQRITIYKISSSTEEINLVLQKFINMTQTMIMILSKINTQFSYSIVKKCKIPTDKMKVN